MTRRGELFELPTPALLTDAPASSSSLLPTPNVPTGGQQLGSAERVGNTWVRPDGSKVQLHLTEIGRLLPTPVCSDSKGVPSRERSAERSLQRALPLSEVVSLLPTPVVNDMGEGKTPQAWDEWTDAMRSRHGNGNGHGASLAIEALRLLPTPRASDGEKGGPNQRGSSGDLMLPSAVVQLLPTPTSRDHKGANQRGDETCLHGALMNPPSPDGSPSSGAQLPGQLSLDATDPG